MAGSEDTEGVQIATASDLELNNRALTTLQDDTYRFSIRRAQFPEDFFFFFFFFFFLFLFLLHYLSYYYIILVCLFVFAGAPISLLTSSVLTARGQDEVLNFVDLLRHVEEKGGRRGGKKKKRKKRTPLDVFFNVDLEL